MMTGSKINLPAERLRQLLSYDPETGVFTWKAKPAKRICVGDVAGRIHSRGYRQIGLDGRYYYGHRLAWLYIYGVWPSAEIDHIDGDAGNNRFANLREATKNQNQHNQKRSCINTSGLKGVTWHKRDQCWQAQIALHGRRKHLGYFDTAEAAHQAYVEASARLHGEFGRVA